MIVVGAVVQLLDGPHGQQALHALETDARLQIGRRHGHHVAVCGVSENRSDDEALWRELQMHPGVAFIDFVFASFEPDDAPPTSREKLDPCTAARS